MRRKLLSMLLVLSMIFSLFPAAAMAGETAGAGGEITAFAALAKTEKFVPVGTALRDLELPESLTTTVRTVAGAIYEDRELNLPAAWTAEPEYEPDTAGVYAFIPEIEGYTVSAPLPEITVTVGAAVMGKGLAIPYGLTTEINNFANLQSAITSPAGDLDLKLSDSYSQAVGSLIIAAGNNYNITIDLNGKTLDGGSTAAIVHNGSGTLTVTDTASGGGGTITCAYNGGTIHLQNAGSVVVNGGTVANTAGSGLAILNEGVGSVVVNGGTVKSKYVSIGNNSTGSVSVSNGTVESSDVFPQGIAINNQGTGSVRVSGGTVKNTSTGLAICNFRTGKITVSGNAVVTGAPTDSNGGTIWLYAGAASDTVLEITGGTIENTSSSGKAIYNSDSGKIVIPSGSPIIKGGGMAMNTAPDLSGYTGGVQITASDHFSGVPTTEYSASSIATYKYLKVEPTAGVTEQFTITPGGTYYFDLSGEKENIGTVNTALPDTTLHYVPFTYAGTVNAYSLTSAMVTTEVYATANKSDRSLFVGDYNIGTIISWNSLNTANLIFGKTFDTNYTLRSLSVGSSKTGSPLDGSDNIGQPSTNEWDQILVKSNSINNTTGWIKNWSGKKSWGQDTAASDASFRAIRGDTWARYWIYASSSAVYPGCGFRPALEVLNPGTLGSNGLKAVTLKLNGGKLKDSTADINIICAGDSFTAPSGEGLTAPVGKTFDGWKDTSSTTTYAAGVTVPNTVTGLTAQWAAAPVNASISLTSASFDPNPNSGYHSDIDVTLTLGSYELISINNGGVPLLNLTHYTANGGGSYTLKKEYLSTLPVGGTTITFQMSGGTSPTLTLAVTDTRTALASVTIGSTAPTFGDTLSATIEPSAATVTYSWKADGSQVGTGTTYEVKAADIGKAITLTITGTGAYKGAVTSPATSAVAAKDYIVTVDSAKNVAQGLGLLSLPTADAGAVTGTLTWYSNSGRTIAAVGTDISALGVGGSVKLYWSFTATTTGYVTTPKTGECVVTIVSGAAQTLSFAESTVTKTVGDPVFTNALTHSVGTGAVTYSSSNTSVATVHPTTGTVAIVGAGTTTITANAAMVPGEYAPGSASFTLTVNAPAKSVSVGPQSGIVTAGTAGSLTYPVTTVNITNGTYAVSVANLPAGVTIGNSGNVTISGNSGTLTLTVADTAAAGTTGTLALTLDGTTSAAFSIVIGEPAPASNHTVTFNPNGGTVSEASRSVAPGTAVGELPTPTRSGSYSFDGWYTEASGGTQIFASTTVSANVTYYAHWTYTSGGSGGSSSGGERADNNSSNITVTPPPASSPDAPTQVEIRAAGETDNAGNMTVNITAQNIADAIEKARADARENGNEQNGITLVLNISPGNQDINTVTVNLPQTIQDMIISQGIVNTVVVVDNPDIAIGLDLAAVTEINRQAGGDVDVSAARLDNDDLSGAARNAIGSRPVFELRVSYGGSEAVESFGDGQVSVAIPYILRAEEEASNIWAVYVDGSGQVHWLDSSAYDSVNQILTFTADHFSAYGVGYREPEPVFSDIGSHWAKDDIYRAVKRGLFSGTSATTFSPEEKITRGMFVTVIGRLAEAKISSYSKSSFADVKEDAYYMPYIEWAAQNNLVKGTGAGNFAPDQTVTREQMAAIISNYAQATGFTLAQVQEENSFADRGNISGYAKEAVGRMQRAGVMAGKNYNNFDPQGLATRSEAAAVLVRFMELAISTGK